MSGFPVPIITAICTIRVHVLCTAVVSQDSVIIIIINIINNCYRCRLNNPDSVKKRSKLVLPKPQISDTELEEVDLLFSLMQN